MTRQWQARPESWWWIAAVVLIPVIVLTGLATLVLIVTTQPATATERIDLVKTALSVGAGGGGMVALILAGRRQWHTEQAHRGTEHDATERRITELYTKAADQLGSDKAPVRLAGLYALERLAQDNPTQRATIVNVICAYLRMPYTPPPKQPPADDAPEPEQSRFEARTQEREVRQTAQRILTTHLRPGGRDTFWPHISLDLTAATLIDFTLAGGLVDTATFTRAKFVGEARFNRARFIGAAWFEGTQFSDAALFEGAQFANVARFEGAQFSDAALFEGALFGGVAWFDRAQFADVARFDRRQFGQIGRCWVRLDVSETVAKNRLWPADWTLTATAGRPGAAGEWGHLVRVQPEHR